MFFSWILFPQAFKNKIMLNSRRDSQVTGINDTGGKFTNVTTSVVDTSGKFATGVHETSGKFATGVNDTGGNLPQVSTTSVANLPLVSTSI